MELHEATFDLNRLLDEVKGMFVIRCQEKSLDFDFQSPTPAPDAVRGDKGKLSQILINLLSNAVKFTDHGSVGLVVQKVEADPSQKPKSASSEARQWYQFEVIDTGVGVSGEARSKVFELFYQDQARHSEGTGLGLTIARRQAALMGGRLALDSTYPDGSRFVLTVPLTAARAERDETTTWGGESWTLIPGQSVNIMVVDDEAMNRDLMDTLLINMGYHVTSAADGFQALEMAQRHPPDLIFLDVRMPRIDGKETLQRMIQFFGSERVKFVAWTASVLSHQREEVLAAGFHDFLGKPVLVDQLARCLERQLNVRFEAHIHATPGKAGKPEVETILLPEAILNRLKAAAERYSLTQFETELARLEANTPECRPVARHLRQLGEMAAWDSISEFLMRTAKNNEDSSPNQPAGEN